jgi:[ribosomal protein S18]-alanine N-acetyltransferase
LADLPPEAPTPDQVISLGLADLADCLGLDRLALGGLWTEEQWRVELLEPRRPVLGWRHPRGELLALASGWLVVDELHITAVAVHPNHRRQGLARCVLHALLATARTAGAELATLEVSDANTPAKGLYASLGFAEVAVRRGYYRNGDDALIQFKKLSQ